MMHFQFFFGTDENAYGASRMYYEATGKPGIIYGSAQLSPTENSKLCDVTIIPKLNTKEHFLDGIKDIRQRFVDHNGPIILLGMGDAYPPLIAHFYD